MRSLPGTFVAFLCSMDRTDEYPESPMPAQQQEAPGHESQMTPRPAYQAPAYRAAGKLKDMVALITGGDSGIGRAVAVLYAREGADVALVYLPEEQGDAEETRQAVEAEGRRALLLPGDVSQSAFCREAVERTVRELGGLHILVNNAAFQQEQARPEDISEEQLDRTFRTNIYGYFFMAQAALPHLQPGSAIINSGSVAGMRGNPTLIDYASTKGAIHAFTKALAKNLIDRGIRVNCVAPGPVWTPLIPMSESNERVSGHGQGSPMGRPAQPEEIAPAFVFLASPADAGYIAGEVLMVLGGEAGAG